MRLMEDYSKILMFKLARDRGHVRGYNKDGGVFNRAQIRAYPPVPQQSWEPDATVAHSIRHEH